MPRPRVVVTPLFRSHNVSGVDSSRHADEDDWFPLQLASPMSVAALAETLDGGQCFRWRFDSATRTWSGVSGGVAAELRADPETGTLEARLLAGTPAQLRSHLADDISWHAHVDRLPWRTDEHLARCIAAFSGLRILRQPIGEALLCFLCSATKQIVQIKQMVALLADRFGRELAPGIHALPSWSELTAVPESELRRCLLGFRAKFIHEVALTLAGRRDWLEETARLPYADAKARLMTLPGVGAKVADCVLLFGAEKLEAFPVDVWVLRAMAKRYDLVDWKPEQVAHFGRVHFGPLAGFAQQFLFAWERKFGKSF